MKPPKYTSVYIKPNISSVTSASASASSFIKSTIYVFAQNDMSHAQDFPLNILLTECGGFSRKYCSVQKTDY